VVFRWPAHAVPGSSGNPRWAAAGGGDGRQEGGFPAGQALRLALLWLPPEEGKRVKSQQLVLGVPTQGVERRWRVGPSAFYFSCGQN
jgi:hypothetical protein